MIVIISDIILWACNHYLGSKKGGIVGHKVVAALLAAEKAYEGIGAT